jgi:hypothetical protein
MNTGAPHSCGAPVSFPADGRAAQEDVARECTLARYERQDLPLPSYAPTCSSSMLTLVDELQLPYTSVNSPDA